MTHTPPTSFSPPSDLNNTAINGATIDNNSRLETNYNVSDNVIVTYDNDDNDDDDATAPTNMRLSYSPTTHLTVNFRGVEYKPTAVIYYHGSNDKSPIHKWNGVGVDGDPEDCNGEVVIEHKSSGGTQKLHIHIMTVTTTNIGSGISKAAEIFAGSGTGIARGATQQPFTANDILPRKPFLFYENGDTKSIVIIPTDNSCYIEIPSSYVDGFTDSSDGLSINPSIGQYQYSSELPAYGKTQMMDDEIYIDCNPVYEGDISEPYKMWETPGMDGKVPSASTQATAKEKMLMVYTYALPIIIPLIMLLVFWLSLRFATAYMKGRGADSLNRGSTPRTGNADNFV